MTFTSFAFHPRVAAGVTALGYRAPTPIQRQSIPPILAGRDVIGLAQTGTGKTAAFVLPILQRLLHGPRGRVRALIIAPTRELAEQTHTTIGTLGAETHVRSLTLYGGVSQSAQVKQLRDGAEVVVACPGRLLDHIRQRNIQLSQLEVLVIDEADRMFDMGFLPDVRRILAHLPTQRQTLLFSATMPDDVGRLARDILRDPVTIQVDYAVPLATVAHALYPVPAHLKTPLLLALLARTDTASVLVFARTKHRAKRIAQQLQNAGYQATSLQGNLSQNRREAAMAGFRDGSFQIMVATDLAARGLDVSQISHVINYDIPDTVDAYTHRIGRTGRAARTGDAFTLITPEDQTMVQAIERAMGSRLERRTLPDFDYRASAPAKPADGSQARDWRPDGRPAARRPSRPAPSGRTPVSRGQGPAHKPAEPAAPHSPAGRPASSPSQPSAEAHKRTPGRPHHFSSPGGRGPHSGKVKQRQRP